MLLRGALACSPTIGFQPPSHYAGTVLSVKEMRALAASLSPAQFLKQMGPFALIQRPPKNVTAKFDVSPQQTLMAPAKNISQGILSLLFQFEDLMVATLPPLSGEDQLTVGRLPDCDLVLEDPSVSKRHALLRWDDRSARCTVQDLGSTNGTYLNETNIALRESRLRDGDILSFGDAQFWYLHTDTLHEKLARAGGGRLGSHSG